MEITIITVSTAILNTLIKVSKVIEAEHPGDLDLHLIYAAREMSAKKRARMQQLILDSDTIMVDLMGTPETIVKDIYAVLEKTSADIIPYGGSGREYLRLGELTADNMKMGMKKKTGEQKPNMKAMKKMSSMAEKIGKVIPGKMKDLRNYSQISKYFSIADEFNITNMLYLLLKDYGKVRGIPKPQEAREIPEIGIREPKEKQYYTSFVDYQKTHNGNPDFPTIAILYYGHTYPNDTSDCVSEICDQICEFANVLPIAFSLPSSQDFDPLSELLNSTKVDLIANFMSFRLGAGPMGGDAQKAVNILQDIDVPYIHPFFMSRRRAVEWETSKQGVNAIEFTLSIMLPELDGIIEALPVGAMCEPDYIPEFDLETRKLVLIEERVEKFIARMKKLLRLRQTANKEKKIAILCYNYPPGEANVFGGSFLDTFKSIEKLLLDLKQEGYTVETFSQEELIQKFTTDGIVNSARYFSNEDKMFTYKASSYQEKIEKLPFYEELVSQWGKSPGQVMINHRGDFLIPGIMTGNVFIGLQPSRGYAEDSGKVYHDKQVLPHHQYLAFYQWLRDEFHADAMIHVGTHGTLEFTRGKECGMSGNCFPDILVSDIPHLYLYYAGNPSEAMIAKRRSHANIISYQPTEFIPGDLYGDYLALKSMIDEYREAQLKSPIRCDDILQSIHKIAAENNMPEDLDEIEHELYRMDCSLIPKGLHTFGIGYDQAQAEGYARALVRQDHGEIAALNRIVASSLGQDYDQLFDQNDHILLSEIEEQASAVFDDFIVKNKIASFNNQELDQQAQSTLEFARNIIESSQKNFETSGLMSALEGHYNPAKLAGDIYRSPEVLPTGHNLYQFDPRQVPSSTAMQRGVKIAENTLEAYQNENGAMPNTTAVILWGLETSRTQGETVSQILAYWGVRAVSNSNVWESKYEVIPLEELGRKRVDVVINICGFFRDMFPNILTDLNKLLGQLCELDEPDEMNCIKANANRIYQQLITSGMETEKAGELSQARIFGPPEGEYGTNLTSIVETKNWQDEAQFGNAFIDSIKHVYSTNYRGLEAKELYTSNLEVVDLVSQIRSNHEYEVTDLDHYFEFFGGLAKSVEITRGKKVKIYITDTTGQKMETETVAKSINRGMRTRLFNPKWIDGMLVHKFHGAQMVADRFENIMGLAATTGEVEDWIYDDMHAVFIEDPEMQQRMKENNPYAYIEILEQMMEYQQRGYWNATDEQLDTLRKVYLETEGDVEENIDNEE